MSTIYYESENSLAHHGIKGQKWGVRRFQNEDGSLTAKGEKRYGDSKNDSSASFNHKEFNRYLNKSLGRNPAKRDPEKVAKLMSSEYRATFENLRRNYVKDNQSPKDRQKARAAYIQELSKIAPLVGGKIDKRGLVMPKNSRQVHKLIDEISRMAGKYSKEEYYPDEEHPGYISVKHSSLVSIGHDYVNNCLL